MERQRPETLAERCAHLLQTIVAPLETAAVASGASTRTGGNPERIGKLIAHGVLVSALADGLELELMTGVGKTGHLRYRGSDGKLQGIEQGSGEPTGARGALAIVEHARRLGTV